MFYAVHASGVRHIYDIWALSAARAVKLRLWNSCLLGQMRHSVSNMTESVDYHCSFLLHKAFAAITANSKIISAHIIIESIAQRSEISGVEGIYSDAAVATIN